MEPLWVRTAPKLQMDLYSHSSGVRCFEILTKWLFFQFKGHGQGHAVTFALFAEYLSHICIVFIPQQRLKFLLP